MIVETKRCSKYRKLQNFTWTYANYDFDEENAELRQRARGLLVGCQLPETAAPFLKCWLRLCFSIWQCLRRILPECASHRLVVHIGFVLVESPEMWDGLGVDQLEDAAFSVSPLDVARTVVLVVQQLQQELPQVSDAAVAMLQLGRRRGQSAFVVARLRTLHTCVTFPIQVWVVITPEEHKAI